jgi:hypothetical protein
MKIVWLIGRFMTRAPHYRRRGRESKEALLFEKRSKNFCKLSRALSQRARKICKSFLVLFSKKELLSYAC